MDNSNTHSVNEPQPSGQNKHLKVLAINASPHKNSGNTSLILDPFIEGLKEASTEVEINYTEDLTIGPCRGDLICFCRESGRCVQSDDMDWLLPKLREADVLVFASPLYIDGVTGPLKTLIDRLCPLARMTIEIHEGHYRHVPRDPKIRKMELVSNCGFWERDNFDPLIVHMKAIAKNLNMEFSGALIRPHGPFMKKAAERGLPYKGVLKAARHAGHQVVETGYI
jgi:FMN-dependent NADH-azoreductase